MSTWDSNTTRNELINAALRKIGALSGTQAVSADKLSRAVEALNLIIREEDLKQTEQSRSLWALSTKALILTANGIAYTTTEGLSNDIRELVSASYRDTSGDDTPIKILNEQQYNALADKNETGDIESIFLKENKALASQVLYIHPAPTSIGTASVAQGSDTLDYTCIMGHTSASISQPITGQNWQTYWQLAGSTATEWVAGTAYTNGNILMYTYKRPLYDFDAAGDNPDMPQGWNRYLIYRLAEDLAPEYGIALDERSWLKAQWLDAYAMIFPSTKVKGSEKRNKGMFY